MTKLRELAEQATPGPWALGDSSEADWFVAGTASKAHPECQVWAQEPVAAGPTAAYIAAVCPDVVMALLDVVEAARAAMEVESHRFDGYYGTSRSPDAEGLRSAHSRWVARQLDAFHALGAALDRLDGKAP